MAHELETWSDGTASFVSSREHAWHRLGTVLPSEFDAAQAMSYARLGGWNVRTMALQTAPVLSDDGVFGALPVPDQFATARTNPVSGGVDVLGVGGPRFYDLPIAQTAVHPGLTTKPSNWSTDCHTLGSYTQRVGRITCVILPTRGLCVSLARIERLLRSSCGSGEGVRRRGLLQ